MERIHIAFEIQIAVFLMHDRGGLQMENKNTQRTRMALRWIEWFLFLVIFALEMLPGALKVPFSSGPDQLVTFTFPYYSLALPFGSCYFSPLFALGFTIAGVVLCFVGLIKKTSRKRFQRGALLCSILIFLLSFAPLIQIGPEYMSAVNGCMAALSLLSIGLLIWAKVRFYRR